MLTAACRPTLPGSSPPADGSSPPALPVDSASTPSGQPLPKELADLVQQHVDELTGTVSSLRLLGGTPDENTRLVEFSKVFAQSCARCHGAAGNGSGSDASGLEPPPRDYRRGIFKFTTTPYGYHPRHSDLVRVIRDGVPGTAMPAHDSLTPETLDGLALCVTALARRGELQTLLVLEAENEVAVDPAVVPDLVAQVLEGWQTAEDYARLGIPPATAMTEESIRRGKADFLSDELGCYRCHAIDGRGQPPDSALELRDSWGRPIQVHDMTWGVFRGGSAPEDMFVRIAWGVSGTPMGMLSADIASDGDRVWSLVHYVQHMVQSRTRANAQR